MKQLKKWMGTDYLSAYCFSGTNKYNFCLLYTKLQTVRFKRDNKTIISLGQDSVMYRSFVSCDDPKGVVECETIRRKYRTCSHRRKEKMKTHKTDENSTRYKEGKVPKGRDQSVNSMIDSWSSGLVYDGRSEDTAKDLLKRVLDMQDSLIMLRKLPEASQHTVHFKRKQTEKPKRDMIDAKMIGRMDADGSSSSSSNCTEELKKVIEESLVSQNVFFSTTTEGLDLASETPTSPSQIFSLTASKMEKGSFNLVAKLMGLEEAPSRSFPAAVKRKHLDGENIMNQKIPVSEMIDLPKKSVHLKGLLKKNFVKEPKLQDHHFNDPNSKQFDDLSHIVLMKPLCTPYQESVRTQKPVPEEDLSLSKLKAQVVSSKYRQRMEKDASKRLTKEKGPKFLKEVVKQDAKGIIINPMEEFSGKVKLYCHVGHTSQVNETSDKKCKVKAINRQVTEKDISEVPRIVARPQDQRKISSTKLRKPLSGSRTDKNEISFLKSTGSNTISTSKTESLKINNCKDLLSMEFKESDSVQDSSARGKIQMKNQSPVAEPEAAKPIDEQIDVPGKGDYTEIRISTTQADELMMWHKAYAYANEVREEAGESSNCSETDSNPDKEEGAELKIFLLGSESFLGQAEKLFNLDVDCPNPKILQKDETNNGIAINPSLYLDCANELTLRKSLQDQSQQVVRSFFAGDPRLHISLGRLVEEIYDAIENLRFYSENSGEELFADNLIAMTEKDMKCNEGIMNGMWEQGWRRGFSHSADEAELVVNEVESLFVSGLIEELIM